MNLRNFLIFLSRWLVTFASSATDSGPLAEEVGGYFEGDMILDEQQTIQLEMPHIRNGMSFEHFKWPNAEVFYKIGSEFDVNYQNQILLALKTIEEATCIRFRPAGVNTKAYINVTGARRGCYSSVGHLGRPQILNLQMHRIGAGCFVQGTIVHEFIHALGFYHQQSAANRDDFVKIAEENIQDGKISNFRKYPRHIVNDFGVPYDYDSVMHYSAMAFSKNGLKTIVPLDPTAVIGQRRKMSWKDILKLNIMYKCEINPARIVAVDKMLN